MNSIATPEAARGTRAPVAPVVRFEDVGLRGEPDGPPPLSFAMPPGDFLVLAGPAGCGKTAILSLICLADRPAAGRVWLFGRDAATLGRNDVATLRRRIGLVFAEDRLLEHLTVFDNAALVPRVIGHKRRDYAPRVAELLTWVGLGPKRDVLPAALSRGQRRRLAIARAVANQPDILLADEPTGDLDGEAALRVLRLLARINEAGTAVLMATRDEEVAASSGARVLHRREGRPKLIDAADEAMAS
ncbi:MAG: ATP-binding cassette domain-containing protein [Pseudomonadota bacterium]|nr:ATP-binding cassette domain-containing protein [Pseudomonadota bacterium]